MECQVLHIFRPRSYEVVSQDIILIDFMSRDMCEKMISLAEDKQFHIMEGDKVPSQDLRLREIGLWKSLERTLDEDCI